MVPVFNVEKEKEDNVAKNSILVSILLFAFISNGYGAEIRGYYSLTGGYDSNPLINDVPLESAIMRNSLGIGYFPEESLFEISYTGSAISFLNIPERNYQVHNIKTDYTFQPFTYQYFEIETSAIGKLRNNSVDGLLYNYAEIIPELSFVLYSDIGIVSLAYSPSFTRFCNYPGLSNSQNELILSLDKTFEFETNLIAEVTYGTRNYFNVNQPLNSPPSPNGKGMKYRHFSNSQNNRQLPNSVFTNQLTNIVDFSLGLTHPISTEIDIGITGNFNIHLNDDGLYYASGSTDLFNEREFFNDYYNFEEKAITIETKYRFSDKISMKANYIHYNRDFLYSLSLIDYRYSSEENRKDSGNLISGEMKYEVAEYFSIFSKMTLNLKIDYFANDSNLKEYTYESASIMISTIWDF